MKTKFILKMSILRFLTLKNEFVVELDFDESVRKLESKNKMFSTKRLSVNEFQIESNLSIGIAIINSVKSFPISTKLSLKSTGEKSIHVNLKSDVRFDIIFFIFILIVLIFAQTIFNLDIPWWATVILFPTIIIFFQLP